MRGVLLLVALLYVACSPAMAKEQAVEASPQAAAEHAISVRVIGNGPDVILVPGLASSTEVWSGLAETLQHGYRLHLVQLAGFAGAPPMAESNGRVVAPAAEALAEYIEGAGINSATVIGHSLGGELGLMLSARYPHLVGRMIVVDALPFYSLLIDPSATAENMMPRAHQFRESLLSAPKAQADAMQAASISRLVKLESARPALVEAGLASDRRTVADATFELLTTDLRPELTNITAEVRVIYAHDPATGLPAERVDALYRGAYETKSDIVFERIDGAFHFIMMDQPEAFAQSVLRILEQ